MKSIEQKIADLHDITMVAIKTHDNTATEYQRGVANGLCLANAVLAETTPVLLEPFDDIEYGEGEISDALQTAIDRATGIGGTGNSY